MKEYKDYQLFEIFNLKKNYNGKCILDISSLSFAAGKIYCIYGPNGSGKSTLFHLLLRLKDPTAGKIYFNGKEIYPLNDGVSELRGQATLVHQNPLLFDTMVERNIDYGLRIRKVEKNIRKKQVDECLQIVDLSGMGKRKARELSGGESQRVAIARALAIQPKVLFLDEFCANVDKTNVIILEKIIAQINRQLHTTILFTTHHIDQAYRLADTVLHLFEGKIVQSALKNYFKGNIRRINGISVFENGNIKIYLAITDKEGEATIVVPSEAISVSKTPVESSMRNCLAGRITHIIDDDTNLQMKVFAGESLEVKITKESFNEMGLKPGMEVYLNFKASAVEVL